jgi:hypothetical protein
VEDCGVFAKVRVAGGFGEEDAADLVENAANGATVTRSGSNIGKPLK